MAAIISGGENGYAMAAKSAKAREIAEASISLCCGNGEAKSWRHRESENQQWRKRRKRRIENQRRHQANNGEENNSSANGVMSQWHRNGGEKKKNINSSYSEISISESVKSWRNGIENNNGARSEAKRLAESRNNEKRGGA